MAIDLSALTAAFDFSSVVPAILAVFAALAGVHVTFKAARLVLSQIDGSFDRKARKLVSSANFDLSHLEARLVLSQHNGNLKRAIEDVNTYGSSF